MAKTIKCDECNGTGTATFHTNEGPYNREFVASCPECDGSGELPNKNWDDDDDENI